IRTGTIDAAAIVRLRGPIHTAVIAVRPLLLHPTAQRCIVRLNEYVAKFRVCRHAAPVWTAVARKDDRAARRRAFLMEKERCEWARVVEAAGFLVNFHAGFRVFRSGVVSRNDVFLLKADAREWRGF